jgi:hypothetical protein
MTTVLLLDGYPVAFVGASRWYSKPILASLGAADRTAVATVCDALLRDRRTPETPPPTADARRL